MAIGIDKDCTTGRVYWSDISTKQIYSARYNGSDKKTFISEGTVETCYYSFLPSFSQKLIDVELFVCSLSRHCITGRCCSWLGLETTLLDWFIKGYYWGSFARWSKVASSSCSWWPCESSWTCRWSTRKVRQISSLFVFCFFSYFNLIQWFLLFIILLLLANSIGQSKCLTNKLIVHCFRTWMKLMQIFFPMKILQLESWKSKDWTIRFGWNESCGFIACTSG